MLVARGHTGSTTFSSKPAVGGDTWKRDQGSYEGQLILPETEQFQLSDSRPFPCFAHLANGLRVATPVLWRDGRPHIQLPAVPILRQ